MYQQFGFFRFGLDAKKYTRYTSQIQEEMVEYFDAKWGSEGTRCIFTTLNELFTLTSARCLLGPEMRALWKDEYAQAYQDLDKSFIPILFFFPNMPHPFAKKCLNARKHFEAVFLRSVVFFFSSSLVSETWRDSVLEKRKGGDSEVFDDFLQVLIESKYKDGSPLSIAEVTGILMAVLLGGQHTSNVTGAWLVMHLLNEPQWRARVLKEQDDILGPGFKGFASFDQVASMELLQKCLDETLRLHPPFFQIARRVQQDTEYKGTVIPEGRLVCISPGAAMRLDGLFDRASEFDPGRFDKEMPAHGFIPFGGGRHICTGRKFALTAIKTATSWYV